jgi:hypothetical protein
MPRPQQPQTPFGEPESGPKLLDLTALRPPATMPDEIVAAAVLGPVSSNASETRGD